jgi:hypothetical protein
MDGENIYHNRVFGHKEEWKYFVCKKMDGTGDHHVEQVKFEKPNITYSLLMCVKSRVKG